MSIRYIPSATVPVPMLSPGTRAVHRSRSSTKTPGATTHNGSPAAKASQRRAVNRNRAQAELNRRAARVARGEAGR